MKTIAEVSKKYLSDVLPDCSNEKIILHIMKQGYQIPLAKPTQGNEITCDQCGGKSGFYIPHLQTWSCKNYECIIRNSRGISRYQEVKTSQGPLIPQKSYVEQCTQSEEVIKFFRSYSQLPIGFVVLAGKNGTGKTFLANACLNDFACDPGDKRLISQAALSLEWLKEIQDYGNALGIIEKYCAYKLLILDDIGTRTPTEAFMDFLYAITDKRYTKKAGTIITTNLNAKQIREKFGDAFTSRIASGKCFRFEGDDRRIQEF
jgi:DNA replication protein DnaC